MKTYEFSLKFSLPESHDSIDEVVERLGKHGCTDALVGIGKTGRLALQFSRRAPSAIDAIVSAIKDVKNAVPEAQLIEGAPDLVGLTDIAELLNFSRQNARKLIITHSETFPPPTHEGKTALWRLYTVLKWAEEKKRYTIDERLFEIAKTNMQLNIARETSFLDSETERRFAEAGIACPR